jgi:hypothetical protein
MVVVAGYSGSHCRRVERCSSRCRRLTVAIVLICIRISRVGRQLYDSVEDDGPNARSQRPISRGGNPDSFAQARFE